MTGTTMAAEERGASVVRKLAEVLVPVGLVLILADLLFWGLWPGINVGIFFAGVALLLLANLRAHPRGRLVAVVVLLLGCCVQAAFETSLSNVVALLALTTALAGEVFQPHLQTWWGRISEVVWGVASSPARWFILAATSVPQSVEMRAAPFSLAANAARAAWVLAPAAVLVLIFGSILGAGNAVFASGVAEVRDRLLRWIGNFDLSFARFVFWAATATLALGIFHGTRAPAAPRWWTRALPRLPRPDFKLAGWQSGAALLALNALFLVINTIDAVYLWFSKVSLPEGVSIAEYVHAGVNSLIAAVLLSAVVIAGLFQQEDRVVGGRWMKLLAHLWVAQNLVLIAGVFLRLKLYVDAHQLTEKRIYVGCFLALVTTGFLLLAWFVQKRRTFNWLLGSNAVASVALFFILQFANVDALIARTNIALWSARWDASTQAEDDRPWLDLEYLFELGTGAWPELQRLSRDEREPKLSKVVRDRLFYLVEAERVRLKTEPWQSWQARRAAGRTAIGAF